MLSVKISPITLDNSLVLSRKDEESYAQGLSDLYIDLNPGETLAQAHYLTCTRMLIETQVEVTETYKQPIC